MGTSQKTFDQVKSILGKLDRTIDSVRQRRLGDPVPRSQPPASGLTGAAAQPNPAAVINGPTLNTTIGGGVASPAPVAPPASRSGYGRAQPLRPEARSA